MIIYSRAETPIREIREIDRIFTGRGPHLRHLRDSQDTHGQMPTFAKFARLIRHSQAKAHIREIRDIPRHSRAEAAIREILGIDKSFTGRGYHLQDSQDCQDIPGQRPTFARFARRARHSRAEAHIREIHEIYKTFTGRGPHSRDSRD